MLKIVSLRFKRHINQDTFKPLTSREWEVSGLVRSGLGNKEIAMRLGISPRTIQVHLSNIFKKLKVQNRVELCNRVDNLSLELV